MKNIMVCYDFSDHSEKAIETAIAWAKKTQGKIQVVHVDDQLVHAGVYADIHVPGFEENARAFREEAFHKKISELEEKYNNSSISIENHLLFGEPVQELLKFAKKMSCDMIIMGSKGTNIISRFMVGGLAIKLMTTTHLPLLCVKRDMKIEPEKVLYAAEMSKNEQRTIEVLKQVCDLFQPHLEVGHIIVPDTELASNHEIDSDEKYDRLERKMKLAHERALFKINKLIKDWNFGDVSTFIDESIHESIGKRLLKKAGEIQPDLIVLGSHSKNFWERIVIGSSSEYVIKRSKKSFLIIPNEEA